MSAVYVAIKLLQLEDWGVASDDQARPKQTWYQSDHDDDYFCRNKNLGAAPWRKVSVKIFSDNFSFSKWIFQMDSPEEAEQAL